MTARPPENLSWLPDSVALFLKHRLDEAGGLFFLVLGLLLAMALVSYDAQDPSANTAADQTLLPMRNWLGVSGAYVADAVMQWLGSAGYMLVLVLMGWSWRLIRHHGLPRPRRRMAALVMALVFGALACGTHGGVVGALLYQGLVIRAGAAFGPLLQPAAGVIAATALLWALALSLSTTLGWLGNLRHSAAHAADFAGHARAMARPWARRMAEQAENMMRREPAFDGGFDGPPPDSDFSDDDAGVILDHDVMMRSAAEATTRRPSAAPAGKKSTPARQTKLDLQPPMEGEYQLPPLDLLQVPDLVARPRASEETLRQIAEMLMEVLSDFGVNGEIVKVHPGPVVTLYELEPAPGTKSSRVIGLADDIARSMSAVSVRVAVVPGRNAIGIEMPNQLRETVYLREMLASDVYRSTAATLPLVLGKDIGGTPVIADLARMPHLLVAGTTGSGKSVAINVMILSLLYRLPPDKCRFIMVDPKMLELSVYEGIPHLLAPVVTDPKKAVVALKWTVREMEDRYRAMSKLGVRNIEGYNARLAEARKNSEILTRRVQTGFDPDTGKPMFEEQPIDLTELPYIVVIVDEMADLMLVAGKDIEATVQRLAQMARAAGIHIITATQRPSVDVITGTIKANFPTRISFQVTSKIDSRTILGEQGAEQLLGQGDMLHMAGGGRITRVHGPFVRDDEVEQIVKFLKAQGEPNYIDSITEDDGEGGGSFGGSDDSFGEAAAGGSGDDLYDRAVALVSRERKASTSFVQRYLQIGYNRAATLIERMEAEGVVSGANHVGKREVLARNIEGDE